jgi:acyl-coenzyme A thioesterase PaaI-like protein
MSDRSGPFWDGVEGFQSTLDMSVHVLRSVRPGRIVARGRILRRNGDLAVIEAILFDPDDGAIATATATAQVIPLDRVRGAV